MTIRASQKHESENLKVDNRWKEIRNLTRKLFAYLQKIHQKRVCVRESVLKAVKLGANRARNEPTGRYYIAIISVRFCRTTAHSSGPPRKLWPQIERPPSLSGFFLVESKQMPRNHRIRTGRKHHHRRPVNENTLIIVRQRPEFRTERWLNGGVVCTLGRLCTSVPPTTATRRGTDQQFPMDSWIVDGKFCWGNNFIPSFAVFASDSHRPKSWDWGFRRVWEQQQQQI